MFKVDLFFRREKRPGPAARSRRARSRDAFEQLSLLAGRLPRATWLRLGLASRAPRRRARRRTPRAGSTLAAPGKHAKRRSLLLGYPPAPDLPAPALQWRVPR